ncbi:A/G-specific adenine glycosylase [Planctomycetota bacterium]
MTETPDNRGFIRRNLLRWYSQHARDLPWRRTRDPYAIWLSEIMLQQTQVETVISYYHRFLKRLPTLEKLARARMDSVLKLWEGLGYYSRARNMQKAARVIMQDYQGVFPETVDVLQTLPGIGRYTAGAIASIAFNRPEPLVDGNVTRVLCRLYRIRMDPKSPLVQKRLWVLAGELVAPRRPGDFNQALMELGATVCRPDNPDCSHCPLRNQCAACAYDEQGNLPLRPPGKKVPFYDIAVGVIYRRGRILIDRRPPESMLGGLWEFPGGKREKGESLHAALLREVREELAIEVCIDHRLMQIDHAYSHFRIRLHVYACTYLRGKVTCLSSTAHRWVKPEQLPRFAFPAANKRIIAQLLTAETR